MPREVRIAERAYGRLGSATEAKVRGSPNTPCRSARMGTVCLLGAGELT
jgi:hypothetical protein